MQIDANDMQITQRQSRFANSLCQAASYGVQPGLAGARSSHLGPRGLGVRIRLHLLQEALQDSRATSRHFPPGPGAAAFSAGIRLGSQLNSQELG